MIDRDPRDSLPTEWRRGRARRATLALLAALVLVSCASGCSGLDRRLRPGSVPPKGEGIVFGTIELGSPVTSLVRAGRVTVIDVERSRTVLKDTIHGSRDDFRWHLPPGRYAVLDIESREHVRSRVTSRRIYAEFAVLGAGEAVYVGTLVVDFERGGKRVVDEYEGAVTRFHEELPGIDAEPARRLLELEEER